MGRLVGTVLVIDDDEIVRFLTKDLIEETGLAEQIVEISGGMEGLQYLIDHCQDCVDCPEVVFLDIRMPGIDGFEFLDIKNTLPNIPCKIIMISSSDRQDDIQKALNLGAADYIVKPLTEEKFKDK